MAIYLETAPAQTYARNKKRNNFLGHSNTYLVQNNIVNDIMLHPKEISVLRNNNFFMGKEWKLHTNNNIPNLTMVYIVNGFDPRQASHFAKVTVVSWITSPCWWHAKTFQYGPKCFKASYFHSTTIKLNVATHRYVSYPPKLDTIIQIFRLKRKVNLG